MITVTFLTYNDKLQFNMLVMGGKGKIVSQDGSTVYFETRKESVKLLITFILLPSKKSNAAD